MVRVRTDPKLSGSANGGDSAAFASLMWTAIRFRTVLLIIVGICQCVRWMPISTTASSSQIHADTALTALHHSHYDSSMQLLVHQVQTQSECRLSPVQHAIVEGLSGLNHWDGIHMLQISLLGGHEIEKETAFFPGMPLLVKFIGTLLQQLCPSLCTITVTLIAAFVLSQLCFIVNAALVYSVSRHYFSSRFAFDATLCFLFNPASIFLLANYTESSFFMLLLIGFLCRARGFTLLSCVAFGMSSLIRSTGWLCVGFVIFDFLSHPNVQAFISFFATKAPSKIQQRDWKRLLIQIVQTIVYVAVVVAPYICLQLHFARRFCSSENIAARPQYCSSFFPHVYSHVQERYWNVGLFRYYELKQIPNFIFALPVWSLSFYCLYRYFQYDPSRFLTLGALDHNRPTTTQKKSEKILQTSENPSASKDILIFMYWWCALLFICVTILHVQVSTRFLSSCLPIYWFAADLMRAGGRLAQLLTLWAATFIIVGTTLFASFLPWT